VGHLVGQLTLKRFQLAGHHVLPLAGGATGMIGDPSGKSAERNLLTREQLDHNLSRIKAQLSRLLDFDTTVNPARLVDNATWTSALSYLDFLREVGKYFSLNVMLAKDSVKSRMDGDNGISYTEFSYQLLQAHDFYHLRKTHHCELQIGGSDQWGNITAGTDLIRKKTRRARLGLDVSAHHQERWDEVRQNRGRRRLARSRENQPVQILSVLREHRDAKVGEYLRKFTLLSRPEIEELEAKHAANPGAREAHKALGREVTRLIHGAAAYDAAVKASEILFGAEIGDTTETTFRDVVGEVPTKEFERAKLDGAGTALTELLVHSGLAPSKGQARKDIEGGGIYVNNVRVCGSRARPHDERPAFRPAHPASQGEADLHGVEGRVRIRSNASRTRRSLIKP